MRPTERVLARLDDVTDPELHRILLAAVKMRECIDYDPEATTRAADPSRSGSGRPYAQAKNELIDAVDALSL